MALINCPECGKEISDKASACPHCGNPLNVPSRLPENNKADFSSILYVIGSVLCAIAFFLPYSTTRINLPFSGESSSQHKLTEILTTEFHGFFGLFPILIIILAIVSILLGFLNIINKKNLYTKMMCIVTPIEAIIFIVTEIVINKNNKLDSKMSDYINDIGSDVGAYSYIGKGIGFYLLLAGIVVSCIAVFLILKKDNPFKGDSINSVNIKDKLPPTKTMISIGAIIVVAILLLIIVPKIINRPNSLEKELLAGHKWGEDYFDYQKIGDPDSLFGLEMFDEADVFYNDNGGLYRFDYTLYGDDVDFDMIKRQFTQVLGQPEDDPIFGLLWETKKYRYTLKYFPDLEDKPIITIQMFNYKYDTREKDNN